jgi:hypothetical protein
MLTQSRNSEADNLHTKQVSDLDVLIQIPGAGFWFYNMLI